jgi:hypothetical protein
MMLGITNTTVTYETLRCAFQHRHDVRLRARYRCILLLVDGKSWPESVYFLTAETVLFPTLSKASRKERSPVFGV